LAREQHSLQPASKKTQFKNSNQQQPAASRQVTTTAPAVALLETPTWLAGAASKQQRQVATARSVVASIDIMSSTASGGNSKLKHKF